MKKYAAFVRKRALIGFYGAQKSAQNFFTKGRAKKGLQKVSQNRHRTGRDISVFLKKSANYRFSVAFTKELCYNKINDSWEVSMAVSYKKLWKLLTDKNMKKNDLCLAAGHNDGRACEAWKGWVGSPRDHFEDMQGYGLQYFRLCGNCQNRRVR